MSSFSKFPNQGNFHCKLACTYFCKGYSSCISFPSCISLHISLALPCLHTLVEVEWPQLDSQRSTIPSCLVRLHERHRCPSGWSTTAQYLQAHSHHRCTHCRLHRQIGMGRCIPCQSRVRFRSCRNQVEAELLMVEEAGVAASLRCCLSDTLAQLFPSPSRGHLMKEHSCYVLYRDPQKGFS